MATSALNPPTCPMCGFDFTLLTIGDKQLHILYHVAITGKLTSEAQIGPRDQSLDW